MKRYLECGVSIAALCFAAGTCEAQTAPAAAPASNNTAPATQPAAASDATPLAPDQAPPASAQSDAAPTKDIIVTGSLIARRDYASDSPIVTVPQASLKTNASVTLEAALAQLPQFTPSASSTYFVVGGQANINLRSLGTNRSLVLVDGHRAQPSNPDGSIDMNTLPTALVSSVETITGGASSAYGSDAMSGVVNVKLIHHFNGVAVDMQYGGATAGDASSKDATLTMGGEFADHRGRVVAEFGYSNRNDVLRSARPFFSTNAAQNTYAFGAVSFSANPPSQAATDSVFSKYGAAPGTVAHTQTVGFNPDGSGTLFSTSGNIVNYKGPQDGYYGIFNDSVLAFTGTISSVWIPMTRYNAFFRSEYDLTDKVQLYAQLMYTHDYVWRDSTFSPAGTTQPALSVPVTNPYIPADLKTLLASRSNPDADFGVIRTINEAGKRFEYDTFNVYQAELGASGEFSNPKWGWEVYASHGSTDFRQHETGAASLSAMHNLLYAPDGGKSVCGSYNIFGYLDGSSQISPACASYISRTVDNYTTITQDVAQAQIHGTLFALPAGDVQVVVGTDYRRTAFNYRPDEGLQTGDIYGFFETSAASGAISTGEGFGELLVPILKDKKFFKNLDADIGYRYSSYSGDIGGLNTYKIDLNWQVVSGLRFRAGYARAGRAPSLADLYQPATATATQIGTALSGGKPAFSGDPCDSRSAYRQSSNPNAGQVRALCLAQGVPASGVDSYQFVAASISGVSIGNSSVRPEQANTYSFGVVLNPKFDTPVLSNISLSVDYYNIKINNAIGTLAAPTSLSKCFNLDGSNPTYSNTNTFCQLVVRNADGSIAEVNQPTFNLAQYHTAGIDAQLDWTIPVGDTSRIHLNVVANRLLSFDVQALPGAIIQDYAGSTGNGIAGNLTSNAGALPTWKVNATIGYSIRKADINFRMRYFSAMKDISAVANPATTIPGTPAYAYFDVYGDYKLTESIQLRAGITNIADKPPAVVGGVAGTTDQALFDPIGRQFFVGAHFKF